MKISVVNHSSIFKFSINCSFFHIGTFSRVSIFFIHALHWYWCFHSHYVNVFIPLASSIQCNPNSQITKHHWNQDVSMYTLKVFFFLQISLLILIFSFVYCSHVFPQIMKDWKLISTHFTLFSSSCTLSMCLFSFIITQNCWNLVNCHDKIIVHIDSSYFQTSSWPFVSYLQISNFVAKLY